MPLKSDIKYCMSSCLKILSCISLSITFVHLAEGVYRQQLVQERAVVKFMNPLYISNVQVFTARPRRSEPYRTNLTATLHQPWGNNVTFTCSYVIAGTPMEISTQACDAVKKAWMVEFVKQYSNVTQCPVLPGTYRFYNIELPPKNFPFVLPIEKGDSIKISAGFHITATKEKILEVYGVLRKK